MSILRNWVKYKGVDATTREYLITCRKTLGYSRNDLARMIGVSTETVARHERGSNMVTEDYLNKWRYALQVPGATKPEDEAEFWVPPADYTLWSETDIGTYPILDCSDEELGSL